MDNRLGFNGIMDMIIKEAKVQFGEDFNTDSSSLFYKLVAVIVVVLAYLEDKFFSLKRSRNIYTAQGEELDDILNNDIFLRKNGAYATGMAIVTGNPGQIINANEIEVRGANKVIYTNPNGFTIGVGGTYETLFRSNEIGVRGNLASNGFELVIKAPTGIKDVTNKNIQDGLNPETDFEYLQRYFSTGQSLTWQLEAIIDKIRILPGVLSCNGERNNTMEVKNGLPAKSIRLVVKGGENQQIAETIYSHIHTADTVGNISVDVKTSVPNRTERISFDRPSQVSIDYQYTIISQNKDEILEKFREYVLELGVGEFVSTEEFRKKKLKDNDFELKLLSIRYKRSSESTYLDYIQLNYDEDGTLGNGVEI